jgi:high-affinity iron transporter
LGGPEVNGGGGWGIFSAILGWTNSATYGSVLSYNLYWLIVIGAFLAMRYNEVKGHWPFIAAKNRALESEPAESLSHISAQSNLSEGGVVESNGGPAVVSSIPRQPAREVS